MSLYIIKSLNTNVISVEKPTRNDCTLTLQQCLLLAEIEEKVEALTCFIELKDLANMAKFVKTVHCYLVFCYLSV